MILDPPEQSAEKCSFLQKNALSCRKIYFPAEKDTFPQKNVALGGTWQETAGIRRRVARLKTQER